MIKILFCLTNQSLKNLIGGMLVQPYCNKGKALSQITIRKLSLFCSTTTEAFQVKQFS
ncbi:hypothetical Protein YC6258_02824 [Gynuella sunshinyii YC6258]|uniref:Uncharacterized protein n=1 Tax=Gynuella sunshinyii YC6258 TaxID=1445510 RepID=A0A0C5VJM9_9GAMM|nr:hypothetical Protein YC6258_02824 [Gynuella sunshinyii YC6258]